MRTWYVVKQQRQRSQASVDFADYISWVRLSLCLIFVFRAEALKTETMNRTKKINSSKKAFFLIEPFTTDVKSVAVRCQTGYAVL